MKQQFALSPNLRQVRAGDWTAVYHSRLGGLCLLDNEADQMLNSFEHGKLVDLDDLKPEAIAPDLELTRQCIARQFLVPFEDGRISPPAVIESAPKVNVVQLVLVNACNFGCTYCFEGVQGTELERQPVKPNSSLVNLTSLTGETAKPREVKVNLEDSVYASEIRLAHQRDADNRLMAPDDAIRYVERAIKIARDTGVKQLMIQFFGGEPMMNWKAIAAVLQEFGNGSRHGIELTYTIVTNGSLITAERAATFRQYGVGVCVSFDSPLSNSRPLKNGKDSRPVVIEGLRKLQAHGVRIAINATLSSATWDVFDPALVDFAVTMGCHEIGVVVDLDPTFYEHFGGERITDKLWSVVEAGRRQGVIVTGYWHQIFQIMNGFGVVARRGFKNCSAKGAQLSIEPNGSVFSCKAGSGYFGSILEDSLLQSESYRAHANLREENPAFCHGCDIEGFCAGICLGPLEKKFGTIDSVEIAACDFYRRITKKFVSSVMPHDVATFDLGSARRRNAQTPVGASA
ncbi:MAG TPA: radical SAM protein [Candidatus Angelobacter sp.]|jgi:uncharacterized protein|nr:radical SAM protein [Candidatus Angelobacter sp.]